MTNYSFFVFSYNIPVHFQKNVDARKNQDGTTLNKLYQIKQHKTKLKTVKHCLTVKQLNQFIL